MNSRMLLKARSMKVFSSVTPLPGSTVEYNDFVLVTRMYCERPTRNNPADQSAIRFSCRGRVAKVPALILAFSFCDSRKIMASSPIHRRDRQLQHSGSGYPHEIRPLNEGHPSVMRPDGDHAPDDRRPHDHD